MIEYENLKKSNSLILKTYQKNLKKFFISNNYILGPNVQLFEKEFSKYCQTPYCVGVASGLDALILSLAALKLKKNTEVLVPSNTYIATITAIIRVGLKPVLIEPYFDTCNISVENIQNKINKKTKVIIITHLYGHSCDMNKIMKLCKKFSLFLIEDCSQAHGARFGEKKVGSFGDFGCFSFYPTKNLGSVGDAGAITLKNKKFYQNLLTLRNYGSDLKNKRKYKLIGYNSRLDEIQSIFLRIKLKKIDRINKKKNIIANIYNNYLDKKNILTPKKLEHSYSVYHIYNIRLKNEKVRNELKTYLKKRGVETQIHYPFAPDEHKIYKKFFVGNFPISRKIHKTTLSLPISTFHKKKDILFICKIIKKFFNK